jgi:hypothetical protein
MGKTSRNRRAGPEHDAGADAVAHQERRGFARPSPVDFGRRGTGGAGSPRARTMIRRRAADSAGRSRRRMARWR